MLRSEISKRSMSLEEAKELKVSKYATTRLKNRFKKKIRWTFAIVLPLTG